jgi:toxin YhaV
MPNSPFDTRNGWRLFTHPAFKTVYDGLVADVGRLAAENPTDYTGHPKAKLLARINTLILEEIPADPNHKDYRQGTKLGDQYKNWFRAKFLKNRFRLFFRFDSTSKIIIYCWVNDENSLRNEGAKTDPYMVFSKMLKSGSPPGKWDDLVRQVVGSD